MNIDAVFSDGTKTFRNPTEIEPGGSVSVRIRTSAQDTLDIFLVSGKSKAPLYKEYVRDAFSYYAVTVEVGAEAFFYYFEILSDDATYYYDRMGISREIRSEYSFCIQPGFSTPDWSKGAVMYQILVDRFCNGDSSNDVLDEEYYYISTHSKHIPDWDRPPAGFDVVNFYGGDLAGVISKLDYLSSIGVEAIYFNPIFISPSNHKYDAQDYDHIDPHIGRIVNDGGECLKDGDKCNKNASKYRIRTTDEKNLEASDKIFIELVEEAHKRGIKVILDGVFNHCGSFHKWLNCEEIYDDGAYQNENSPFCEFFAFKEKNWPGNNSYEGWWNHNTLPKLNYEASDALCEQILRIGAKWLCPPYNADGWRLDVAEDLGHSKEFNHLFWKRFRDTIKNAKPDAIILAEHYGDASDWLRGDEWDTVMNYDGFMDPVTYFFTGMEKHSDRSDMSLKNNAAAFKSAMEYQLCRMTTPSVQCSMNQLSNHDHSRFLTRTSEKVGRIDTLGSEAAGIDISKDTFKLASLFQMTWPGAPTIYYADEAGQVGFTDPDSRRTYPWGAEDKNLIGYFRDIAFLRKSHKALKTGSVLFLECEEGFISFGRFTEDEHMVIVINNSLDEVTKSVSVWRTGMTDTDIKRVLFTGREGHSILPEKVKVINGAINLRLGPKSGMVFVG